MLRVFSLVLLAFLSVDLRPVYVWSCFWASCPFACCGSRFSSPCGVSRFAALSLFLSVPGILMAWMVSSSVLFDGAPPSPFCSSAFSWFWSDSFYSSSPSLFVRSWGRCSPNFPHFSPSGLLSARPFVQPPCPLGFSLLLVVCSCLLSPVGRFVLQGLRGFGVPLWSGVLFHGLSLFCAFGLYLFGSRPSFLSCSSGILRPGGYSFPWVGSSTPSVLAHSSGDGFPGVVCSVVYLQSCSPFRCRGSVFFLRLRFVRRLSPSVVFFSAFAMGSPWSGSSVCYGFYHSIGTKA